MDCLRQTGKTLRVFTLMWRYLKISDQEGACYDSLKKRFTEELIAHLRLRLTSEGRAEFSGPALYVCNHISYLDIPLIMNQIPEACFVSKQEVGAWPLIGRAAKRIGTVFVKREKKSSREAVRAALKRALVEERKKIALFPSSTTTLYKTDKWRKGAFEIARDCGVPIIPVRLHYAPLRAAAYVDKDPFLIHLFRLFETQDLQVRIEFAAPVFIEDPVADCARVQKWCEEGMAVAPAMDEAAISAAAKAWANPG